MTRKQIEALPYGSSAQNEAADAWMDRFMPLLHQAGPYGPRANCDWLTEALRTAHRRLFMADVWCIAKQRWNDRHLF